MAWLEQKICMLLKHVLQSVNKGSAENAFGNPIGPRTHIFEVSCEKLAPVESKKSTCPKDQKENIANY